MAKKDEFTAAEKTEIKSKTVEIFGPCPCDSAAAENCSPEFSDDLKWIGNERCHRMASIESTFANISGKRALASININTQVMTTKEEILGYEFAFGRATLNDEGELEALEESGSESPPE